MKSFDRSKKIQAAGAGLAALLFATTWASGVGLALNTTPSMPRGLYLTKPMGYPKPGDIAAVCIPPGEESQLYLERDYLPASFRCPSGVAPVLKPIAAVPGDYVQIEAAGVRINGELQVRSRTYATDSDGRPMAHLADGWKKTLAEDEYFVLANHIERSLDSRYYGTVARAAFLAKAFPLTNF